MAKLQRVRLYFAKTHIEPASSHTPIDPAKIPVPAEAHCRRFVEAVFRRLQQRRCQAIALTPQRVFGERPASL